LLGKASKAEVKVAGRFENYVDYVPGEGDFVSSIDGLEKAAEIRKICETLSIGVILFRVLPLFESAFTSENLFSQLKQNRSIILDQLGIL
jgi:hypothetical protein